MPLEDVTQIVPEGEETLVVQGADGSQRVYGGYDTVEVEAQGDSRYEFEKPVSAHREPGVLSVDDQYSSRSFRLEEVEAVRVWDYAPERPWIIAGATVGATILGSFVFYQLPGECHPDEEMGCLGNGLFAMLGAGVGFGVGLGVSIPLSGTLHPKLTSKPGPAR